jgi:chromate transporter
MTAQSPKAPSLTQALPVWTRVALLSFGGPAGQIAVMHRILVDEKRWVSEQHFLHALNFCMLLPGPEAHQLAVYLGWRMHRIRGGLVSGTLFILPGLITLGLLSWLYAAFRNIGFVASLFFGLKAAVLAIVLEALLRIGKRALRHKAQLVIAALAFAGIFFLAIPFPVIILAAGLAGYAGQRWRPSWFAGQTDKPSAEPPTPLRGAVRRFLTIAVIGGLLWLGPLLAFRAVLDPNHVFVALAAFNSKMAVVTFGGAYAVLAYMAQQAVEYYHWLKPGEMLVGLGLAETTPGPLISVVQFVGFMAAFRAPGTLDPVLAGTLGGLIAMWCTFVPSFLWIFLGAPYIERLAGNKAVNAALSAITAAVVGVILNLAVWFALQTLFRQVDVRREGALILHVPVLQSLDWAALAIALAAMVALFRFKLGMIRVLAASCIAGACLFALRGY